MGENSGEERKQEPNLELPSIFGRRKKKRRSEPETAERSADAQGAASEEEERAATTEAPRPSVDPDLDGAASPVGPPHLDEAPTMPPEVEATRRLPDTAYAAREHEAASAPDVAEPVSSAPTDRAAGRQASSRAGGRRAARAGGPTLPGPVAAVLTGVVVGLFGAGATYGGTQGCDAWRGTSSCGGGPGLLLVVAILALMVLLGAGLLALLGVPEPRSTSFLGVGLTFVVVLVALMSAVFSVWMFFAAPVLSAAAYGVAHWVSTRHVELPEAGPEHDVR
ncbi:MAG: hypothetical protein ACTHOK_05485 [Nocardioidaceae bacterium]